MTVAVGVLAGATIFVTLHETTTLQTGIDGTYNATTMEPSPLTFVVGAGRVDPLTFVSIFFSAALVAGAYQRLTGGEPTLSSVFGAAAARLPQILGWTLLAGTVNLILNQIENQGIIGSIVGNLLQTGWRVATWLAVPVIIVEGPGPWTSLKRAGGLFKQTWGENLIAQAVFSASSASSPSCRASPSPSPWGPVPHRRHRGRHRLVRRGRHRPVVVAHRHLQGGAVPVRHGPPDAGGSTRN